MDGGIVITLIIFAASAFCFFSAGTDKAPFLGISAGLILWAVSMFTFNEFSFGPLARDNNFWQNNLDFATLYENVGSVKVDERTIVIIRLPGKDAKSSDYLQAYLFETGSEPPNGLFTKVKNEAGEPVYVPYASVYVPYVPKTDVPSHMLPPSDPNKPPNLCKLNPPPPWC